MSNISTYLKSEKNLGAKSGPDISLVSLKEEEQVENFKWDKRDHYNEEVGCEKTDGSCILNEEVKQEPSYQTTQSLIEYQKDPLYSNAKIIKEEYLFKEVAKEEFAEQRLEDIKYSIDIVEHKVQYRDDNKDISLTSEHRDIEFGNSGIEKNETTVSGTSVSYRQVEPEGEEATMGIFAYINN